MVKTSCQKKEYARIVCFIWFRSCEFWWNTPFSIFLFVALVGKWAEQILLLFLGTKFSLLSFKNLTHASNVNLSLGNEWKLMSLLSELFPHLSLIRDKNKLKDFCPPPPPSPFKNGWLWPYKYSTTQPERAELDTEVGRAGGKEDKEIIIKWFTKGVAYRWIA